TEVIAYILRPGETAPGKAPAGATAPTPAAASQAAAEQPSQVKVTPIAEQMARENGVDLSQVPGSGPGGRVTRTDVEKFLTAQPKENGKIRATPAARHAASELGADLHQVQGSGPRGRIQGTDVRAWAESLAKAAPQPAAAPPRAAATVAPSLPGQPEPQVVPLSNVRRLIGERLQQSAQEAPHIYLEADIETDALEALRQLGNKRIPEGQPKISMTALLLRAVAWTLVRHPMLNSQLDGDRILVHPEIHLGVAVAVDYGLIVPVIRDVDRKSLSQLALELDDLVSRARQNRLRPDDVSGGTFTISNLGMFGVDRFTAIINPPQAGILAVGRSHKVFVPDENDQPVVRTLMTVTVGVDHRVVDGAIAARFLADLRDCIEHPELMVL
ncbi:MAG TPA: 2-oxo acid dehydrogenase subunit E2, partial [Anaerolineaceae bacterium]